jgi:hypothetical protein
VNFRNFAARIHFAAPKDAAYHPTLQFIPASSCKAFSLDFGNGSELQLTTDKKSTVIVVTHNIHIAEMADRIIVMRDGKLQETEPIGTDG